MGHKNILQKQLRFKLKPREQNDSILNGGKMAFIGRERSCHLVLKCSRVLRFSSPPLCVQLSLQGTSTVSNASLLTCWGASVEEQHHVLPHTWLLQSSLWGQGAWLAWPELPSIVPCVPIVSLLPLTHLPCPLAPVHSTRCSHQLYEEAEPW